MTTAHVEKFAELVAKDPALLAKLGLDKVNSDAAAASASAAAFLTTAVKEAKALGLVFTEEEARAFMAAEAKAAASGELSDTQLEAVAGGKALIESHESDEDKRQREKYEELKKAMATSAKMGPGGGIMF